MFDEGKLIFVGGVIRAKMPVVLRWRSGSERGQGWFKCSKNLRVHSGVNLSKKHAVHFDVAVVIERLTSNKQILLENCDGNLGSVQNQVCSNHFLRHIHDGPCIAFPSPEYHHSCYRC